AATRPPLPAMSSATASKESGVRSRTATAAPSSASRWAVARPIPLAAPVTTATFPSIDRLSWVRRGMGRDRSAGGRTVLVDLSDLAWALLVACVFAFPLALTLWALLDAA